MCTFYFTLITQTHVGLFSGQCKPLYCQGNQIGLVRPQVEDAVKPYKDAFKVSATRIDIVTETAAQSQDSDTFEEISSKIDTVLRDIRDSPNCNFVALGGWRDECYNIRPGFSAPPLFKMERSATCKI